MSASKFARRIDLSRQRYFAYEKGMSEPSIEIWRRISAELPVGVDFIISGKPADGQHD